MGELSVGGYTIGPRLGAGGMGQVHLAVRRGVGGFEKPVALKLLLPHLSEDAQAVALFLREARLAARMTHPNVVQITDVGGSAAQYFIAMELVREASLAGLIRSLAEKGSQLPSDLISYVATCLCHGLHYAHEQAGADGAPLHLVHRDVSPHNVLVSVDGEVKLSDFGIAKARDFTAHTRAGQLKGKLEYASPEQLWSKPLDRRADLYSLGISLFQLATLLSPFRRESDAATVAAIERDELPPLKELRPDLDPALASAIERACAKDSSRRPATGLELAVLLPAPPAGAAERLGAVVRQHFGDRALHLELASVGSPTVSGQSTVHSVRGTSVRWAMAAVALVTVLALAAWLLGRQLPQISDVPRPASSPVAGAGAVVLAPVTAPAAPELAPSPVPVERAPPGSSTPREHRADVSAAVAYVSVDAVPWATVSVNGQRVGDTPLYRFPIAPGSATLEMVNPETGKKVQRRITLKRGQHQVVKVSFD